MLVGGVVVPLAGWCVGLVAVWFLHERIRVDSAALPLGGLVGMVLAIIGWRKLLHAIGRWRLAFLRRSGIAVAGAVIGADYEYLYNPRGPGAHMVTIDVRFAHPVTGAVYWFSRRYRFPLNKEEQAREFAKRFRPGDSIPVLMRRKAVALDIAERPYWAYLW
ncbi:hypothetical protein AB0N05_36935 [Nocardia sp. NPDC051030]|uniref:hypothetical protein n=1 Tax=Nocardia sp. NPDC051030 TaxID=3155162 RepID=UPI003427AB70